MGREQQEPVVAGQVEQQPAGLPRGRGLDGHPAREAGGLLKLWRAMRSKNACKTCALGMGGQRGGMVNELGNFPEVCKKSLQAMVADMQGAYGEETGYRPLAPGIKQPDVRNDRPQRPPLSSFVRQP